MKKYNKNSNVILGCQKCPNYTGNYISNYVKGNYVKELCK